MTLVLELSDDEDPTPTTPQTQPYNIQNAADYMSTHLVWMYVVRDTVSLMDLVKPSTIYGGRESIQVFRFECMEWN